MSTTPEPAEEFSCTCGAPDSAHCQTCWGCPGWHEDMCGF